MKDEDELIMTKTEIISFMFRKNNIIYIIIAVQKDVLGIFLLTNTTIVKKRVIAKDTRSPLSNGIMIIKTNIL